MSQFFNGSCVPVNNPRNYPSSLCALCVGDEKGRNKCVGSSQERYYGYSGAFRYLVVAVGKGDLLAWLPPGGIVLLTSALLSCVTGVLQSMRGMWPSSSTQRSLRIQMVCEGAWARAKSGGRGLVPVRSYPGTGRCWDWRPSSIQERTQSPSVSADAGDAFLWSRMEVHIPLLGGSCISAPPQVLMGH